MFITSDCSIYELLQFNEKCRSWFINDTVSSNGKIYLTSRIDPLFIFIQYLEKHCKSKAQPLDQILEDSAIVFSKFLKSEQMRLVADQKGPDDLKAFIYNEEKTIKWLKKKFTLMKDSLTAQKIVGSGVASMNFVKSSLVDDSIDEDAIAETALGIMSEYISLDLIDKLDQIYGISEKSKQPINQKRKPEEIDKQPDSKKIKAEEQEKYFNESPTNTVKTHVAIKVSTKSKALQKASKGSKNISSFFTKN